MRQTLQTTLGRPVAPRSALSAQAGPRLRVLVVTEDTASRNELVERVWASGRARGVRCAPDSVSALRMLSETKVDLVLIDLGPSVFDAFELAQVLQAFARPPAVIFLAADPSWALEAFDVGAVDFLLRPVGPARLMESLGRVRPLPPVEQAPPAPRQVPDVLAGYNGLSASSVQWIGVRGDYARVHTKAGSVLLDRSLGSLVQAWGAAGIVRIHRAYAVQLAAVAEVRKGARGYSVVVDGAELPISRRAFPRVKEQLFVGE